MRLVGGLVGREIDRKGGGRLGTKGWHKVNLKFSEERALELWEAGWSDVKVARELKVSRASIFYWRRRNDYPPNGVSFIEQRDAGWSSNGLKLQKNNAQ